MKKEKIAIIILIFSLAIIAEFACLKFLPNFPVEGDSIAYNEVAKSILQGKGFSENGSPSMQAPVYPLFLAIAYFLFGSKIIAIKLIQIFLLGLIAIFAYFISQKLQQKKIWSLLGAILVIFWPYLLLYTQLVLTEILFSFLLIFIAWLAFKTEKKFAFTNLIILTIISAIAALLRPSFVFFPVWISICLLIFCKTARDKQSLKKFVFFILFFFALLTPWITRSSLIAHKFIFLHPEISSVISKSFITMDYTQNSQIVIQNENSFQKIIVSRLKNIYLFWNPGAQGTRAQELSGKSNSASMLFSLYKILFFIVLGLTFISLKFIKQKEIFLLWLFIFYFWILHIALFPYPRYALPIIPFVIILACFTLSKIFPWLISTFSSFYHYINSKNRGSNLS